MNFESIASVYCPASLRPILAKVRNSPVGSRLAKGMFWSMAGTVISRGLMLVASVLVARILGRTVFGEYGMIRETVGMFGVFAGFGLGLTATKYVAEFRHNDPARAGRIIGISGVFATVTGGLTSLGVYILAPWLAEHTINAAHLTGALRIGSLIMFLSALNGAQTGALAGFEAFKTIAYVNLFTGLLSFPVLVSGAYFGGVTGAIWASAINLGFNWLLNRLALRREARRYNVPFTLKDCCRERSVLWRFSLPAFLSGTVDQPVYWACGALLVNQPDGYSEMGVLTAALQWFMLLLFLPGLLGGVVLPVLSERIGAGDAARTQKTLILAIEVNSLFAFPFALCVGMASPYIMNLYGKDFTSGWPTLVVVLLQAAVKAAFYPVGQLIAASGRMWLGFAMNVGWSVVIILSTLLLLGYGSFGVAGARLIASTVHAVWVFAFAVTFIRRKKAEEEVQWTRR